MAGISVPDKVCVLEYRGHKFYADVVDEGAVLEHFDPKGRKIKSECYGEMEAMDLVDSIYQTVETGYVI